MNKEFYQQWLTGFDFQVPDSLREVKSIIVVAVPRSQSQIVFMLNGEKLTFTLLPTYVAYGETAKHVEGLLARMLADKGYRVARAELPLKLLAVRSGRGWYWRNNICYVLGMGSFLQLVAVYSDLPCQKDSWQEAQMMKSCQKCDACCQNCPTKAISSDRFLLRAERCLVSYNEKRVMFHFLRR